MNRLRIPASEQVITGQAATEQVVTEKEASDQVVTEKDLLLRILHLLLELTKKVDACAANKCPCAHAIRAARDRDASFAMPRSTGRRLQVQAVIAFMTAHPYASIFDAAKKVWKKTPGGYASAKCLYNACHNHEDAFMVLVNAQRACRPVTQH